MEDERKRYGKNYARFHGETKFDVLNLANTVRNLVAKYIVNEKYVSKKWRYLDGKPALDCARAVRDQVSYANGIQIDTDNPDEYKVRERLDAEEKALRYCNILQAHLLDIVSDCEQATHESMRQITNTLSELMTKMKKWNDKDIERFSYEE